MRKNRLLSVKGHLFIAHPLYEEDWHTGRNHLVGWDVTKDGEFVGQYASIATAREDLADYPMHSGGDGT